MQSIEKQAPTKYPEDPEDKKSGKSQTRKIIVVKPTKKIDATSDNLEEDEEQKREEERERQNRYNWINDSSLMPLSKGEAEQIGVLEATCDVHGDSVVGRRKKKNGKQVIYVNLRIDNLHRFHVKNWNLFYARGFVSGKFASGGFHIFVWLSPCFAPKTVLGFQQQNQQSFSSKKNKHAGRGCRFEARQ